MRVINEEQREYKAWLGRFMKKEYPSMRVDGLMVWAKQLAKQGNVDQAFLTALQLENMAARLGAKGRARKSEAVILAGSLEDKVLDAVRQGRPGQGDSDAMALTALLDWEKTHKRPQPKDARTLQIRAYIKAAEEHLYAYQNIADFPQSDQADELKSARRFMDALNKVKPESLSDPKLKQELDEAKQKLQEVLKKP
jgi:hypothetical protein